MEQLTPVVSGPSEKHVQQTPSASSEDKLYSILIKGNRDVITDFYIGTDVSDEPSIFSFKVYVRLNAKKKTTFRKVSFTHCVFDSCYFNNCVFDSCNFIGCRFVASNFHKSAFTGCKFEYATFERCQIDDEILRSEAPREENLRMRFARSLRMNYQQIGDAKAVNNAISLELKATSIYLFKSWNSVESYYKNHYGGWRRIKQFFRWLEFWALNFVWGNGESILKLLRTSLICVALIGIYDISINPDARNVETVVLCLQNSPGIFLGLLKPENFPILFISILTAIRLVLIALLTALLVKRFSRR